MNIEERETLKKSLLQYNVPENIIESVLATTSLEKDTQYPTSVLDGRSSVALQAAARRTQELLMPTANAHTIVEFSSLVPQNGNDIERATEAFAHIFPHASIKQHKALAKMLLEILCDNDAYQESLAFPNEQSTHFHKGLQERKKAIGF